MLFLHSTLKILSVHTPDGHIRPDRPSLIQTMTQRMNRRTTTNRCIDDVESSSGKDAAADAHQPSAVIKRHPSAPCSTDIDYTGYVHVSPNAGIARRRSAVRYQKLGPIGDCHARTTDLRRHLLNCHKSLTFLEQMRLSYRELRDAVRLQQCCCNRGRLCQQVPRHRYRRSALQ